MRLLPARPARWTAVLLAVALAGCATIPSLPAGRRPRAPVPAEPASYYDYTPLPLRARSLSREARSGYAVERLELSTDGQETPPVRVDWYRTGRPGRRPLVLMSPILAGDDLYVREFAAFYAARGIHAVIVYRQKEPFSTERPLKEIETHFRETIIGMRRALDWLETRDGVDSSRIGTFAISLGAILTSILAAVEPRVRCSVLGLPAGRVAEIIMTSRDRSIRKKRRAYLKKHGWTREQGLRELQEVIVSDPLRFAARVDPERVLMIAAAFDRVLGIGRSLELWRAMGRPQLILLPTGHYTAYLATPYLKIATYSFFSRKLEAKP